VTFSPLPCWKDLSPEAYQQRVANMAAEIEEDAAAARKRTGAEPLGVRAILAQDPTNRPKRLKKSPAPLFHAASQAMRHYFYEGFSWFVAAYRTAAEKLQRGDLHLGKEVTTRESPFFSAKLQLQDIRRNPPMSIQVVRWLRPAAIAKDDRATPQ
jgi:hypothetical protein